MGVRTSSSDPIMVNHIPAVHLSLPGRVGMTFAPGKRAMGVSGNWYRDLDADVDRLVNFWRMRWLISLVEDEELVALGIDGLVGAGQARGAGVKRFPFPDGGVPSFEMADEASKFAIDAASRGENVVIHCRGGLGRTGLIAACALVRHGMDPTRATRVVRSARPGAIENVDQERFIYDFTATRLATRPAALTEHQVRDHKIEERA